MNDLKLMLNCTILTFWKIIDRISKKGKKIIYIDSATTKFKTGACYPERYLIKSNKQATKPKPETS